MNGKHGWRHHTSPSPLLSTLSPLPGKAQPPLIVAAVSREEPPASLSTSPPIHPASIRSGLVRPLAALQTNESRFATGMNSGDQDNQIPYTPNA